METHGHGDRVVSGRRSSFVGAWFGRMSIVTGRRLIEDARIARCRMTGMLHTVHHRRGGDVSIDSPS